ncbi:uncharacterized protein BN629_01190 [Eggerthella sp. CAG:368]|nr:uncharacterized protein BN629_01190 [Eggerthella sp. CAG:368]
MEREPYYDLEVAQNLVKEANYRATKRLRNNLQNHGYIVDETIEDVFAAIRPENYYKTDKLENIPGVFADIYRHVICYGEEWYVKFFIEENGKASLEIWSLKEDGYTY